MKSDVHNMPGVCMRTELTAPAWATSLHGSRQGTQRPVVRGSRYMSTGNGPARSMPTLSGLGQQLISGGFGTDFSHADNFFIKQRFVFLMYFLWLPCCSCHVVVSV